VAASWQQTPSGRVIAPSAGMTLGRDPLLLLLQELGWLDTTFELWWQVQDSNLRRR
jgi:hypothetical protein